MIFALIAIGLFSCTNENTSQKEENLNFGEGLHLDLQLKIDFTKPVTYTFSSVEERQHIIDNIVDEIFEGSLASHVDAHGRTISEAIEIGININNTTKILTVYPGAMVVTSIQPVANDDNSDCGGKAGDGWAIYGSCMNQDCVKEKSATAVAALSRSRTSAKIMDIRIKRNASKAWVYTRVDNC